MGLLPTYEFGSGIYSFGLVLYVLVGLVCYVHPSGTLIHTYLSYITVPFFVIKRLLRASERSERSEFFRI